MTYSTPYKSTSMNAIDEMFNNLLSTEPNIDDSTRSILLRNKASFTSQFSDQMFIQSYFKKKVNNEICKTIISQVIVKFKEWIRAIVQVSYKGKIFNFEPQGVDCSERDIFGQAYNEFEGEEFDLDNVMI